MPWGIAATAVIGAVASDRASSRSSRASQQATDATVAEQQRQYDQTREDFAPARALGTAAIADINQLYGRGRDGTGTGAPDMSRFFQSPDYQFNLSQGQRAIDNSLAARGKALSGAGVKAGARFAQGLASTEFGNYVNRLSSQAGLGQAATGSTAAAGAGAAGNIGAAYMANGQNRASAYQQQAAGINNAVVGGVQNYMLYKYLNPSGVDSGWGSGSNLNSAWANR